MKKLNYRAMLIVILALFSPFTHAQSNETDTTFLPPSEIITADNIDQLQEVGVLGLGAIHDITYSPNGQRVAITSAIGLSIYAVDDWSRPLQVFRYDDSFSTVAFTADNETLITYPSNDPYWLAPENGHLIHHDIRSGASTILIENFTDAVDLIATDPSGRWIATVEQECRNCYTGKLCGIDTFSFDDVRINIWEMSSGTLLHTITPEAYILDIEFKPDTASLVYLRRTLNEAMDELVFWDVNDGNQINSWTFTRGYYTQFAISGDGNTIGLPRTGSSRAYVIIDFLDIQTGALTLSYEALEADNWVYHPDFDYTFQGRIWLNDDASQIFTQEYLDPGIAFYVWDIETNFGTSPQPELYIPIQDIAFSPIDDSALLIRFNDSVLQWEEMSQEINILLSGQRRMENLILSADNRLLAIQGEDGDSLYDLQTGRRLLLPENGRPLAISNNHELMALAVDNEVHLWNINQDVIRPFVIPAYQATPLTASFSPDNTLLAIGLSTPIIFDDEENIVEASWQPVRIYDLATSELLAVEQSYAGRSEQVTFSADGTWLITDVGVWDVNAWLSTGLVDQSDPERILGGMTISADGRYTARVLFDEGNRGIPRIIQVYDVVNERELYTFDAHHGEILGLAFNPSGTLLASASGDYNAEVRDNSVRIWNLETGEELITVEIQQNDFMRDVVFTSDGRYLITVRGGCPCEGWGFNSAVRIWGVPMIVTDD